MISRLCTIISRLFTACAALIAMAASSFAIRAVPENLGNGLDKLVESNLAVESGAPAPFNGFTTTAAQSYATIALTEAAAPSAMYHWLI